MKYIAFSVCLVFFVSLNAKEKLLLTGSSTVAPLAKELAKEYMKTHKDVRIDVQTGGSSRGIMDVRRGSNDIGMVSRSLKEKESYLQGHLIAKDGIAIIVHSSNPISELSKTQIKEIYLGKTNNWKDMGGEDLAVDVISKAAGRSTLELFLKHFVIEYRDIKASSIIGDNEQAVKAVLRSKGSIAYVSIGTAEYHKDRGAKLKALALNGVEASSENVKNASYPLSRELNFVTKSKPQGLKKDFIDFAKSKGVNKIVEEQYFVPVE